MSYTLMISEKPAAAKKIAQSLADPKTFFEQEQKNGSAYYTFTRKKKKFVVVPAVGHLFGLKLKNGGEWTYPVFNPEWIPVYEMDKENTRAKKFYKNFKDLYKDAEGFIVCTDWDTEGSVIAYNILRFICKTKNAERMFFTTLTKEEITESFENRAKKVHMGEVNAGLARHQLDWMYGVNITRALTLSLQKARKGFRIISTGRVQGPTLKILTDKEKKIRKFKPEDYWEINLEWMKEYTALHKQKKIFDKQKADKIKKECEKGKCNVKKTRKVKGIIEPPIPFNITGLQTEAYHKFGYSPGMTQNIAQKLYINALTSYPRTSSQKLPEKIGYRKILEKLGKQEHYKKQTSILLKKKTLKPKEGKKIDRAHTAIYPTGEKPEKLTSAQQKVYDLIVKRFFAVFGEQAVKETTRITLEINNHDFKTSGIRIIEPGWIKLYSPYGRHKETHFPELKEGQEIKDKKVIMEKKQTLPPKRYTQAGIIKKMEDLEIGTKSTRASILQTLYHRRYVSDKQVRVTELGIGVINTLSKHCPRIISEELTRKFEKQMHLIIEHKESKEEVINQAQEIIIDISRDFKDHEEHIGKEINTALELMWKKESNVGKKIGKCDKCGADMIVMFSKRFKSEFVGCSKYPECRNSYHLPVKIFETTRKECGECGAPIIIVHGDEFCLNPHCKSRILDKCDKCGADMVLRMNKKGRLFLGCSAFPKCRNVEKYETLKNSEE